MGNRPIPINNDVPRAGTSFLCPDAIGSEAAHDWRMARLASASSRHGKGKPGLFHHMESRNDLSGSPSPTLSLASRQDDGPAIIPRRRLYRNGASERAADLLLSSPGPRIPAPSHGHWIAPSPSDLSMVAIARMSPLLTASPDAVAALSVVVFCPGPIWPPIHR